MSNGTISTVDICAPGPFVALFYYGAIQRRRLVINVVYHTGIEYQRRWPPYMIRGHEAAFSGVGPDRKGMVLYLAVGTQSTTVTWSFVEAAKPSLTVVK
jgi:hypothetical protein